MVSGDYFTPLAGVLFTFPSRYSFTIGRRVVFSLGRWSSRIPAGFHVPCGTRGHLRRSIDFAYRTVTFYGGPFQNLQLSIDFVTPRKICRPFRDAPQPRACNACKLAHVRFRLFPVRSPLLGESRLLSVPAGTKMFQFPALALTRLSFSARSKGHYPLSVSRFGNPRIKAC